jgi:hypothetical protein
VTLELRDIESVKYQSAAIVLQLSLTRAPSELETELIQAWPAVRGTDRPLRVEGRDLLVEVASADAATTCVAWLMGEEGLSAMSARALVVEDAGDQLHADVRALIHRRYDAVSG